MYWNHPIGRRVNKGAGVATIIAAVSACTGGSLKFDQTSTKVQVAENTGGIFWSAKAITDDLQQPITYGLAGPDSQWFILDVKTGALWFKTPADFENPYNKNSDNSYQLEILAYQGVQKATQSLNVEVRDVVKPIANVISPRPYANVGDGTYQDIEITLKAWDEESNSPLKNVKIKINNEIMTQSSRDAYLWAASPLLDVPTGEFKVNIDQEGKTLFSTSFELYNKRTALKPSAIAVATPSYLYVYSAAKRSFIGVDLTNKKQSGLYYSGIFDPGYLMEYDPVSRRGFTVTQSRPAPNNSRLLLNIEYRTIPEIVAASPLPNEPVGIFRDNSIQRLLVLSQSETAGERIFSLYSTTTGAIRKIEVTKGRIPELMFELPKQLIKGNFKYFVALAAQNTFIFADERTENGTLITYIQGINAAGKLLFDARTGPDISNMVIDANEGLIYVAERCSSESAQIKTIRITDGTTQSLPIKEKMPHYLELSTIQIDGANKKLYAGDTVADSLFEIDLATQSMREIVLEP